MSDDVAPVEESDNDTDLLTKVTEHVQRVARKPESKFGVGGFALGALATVALLGSMLQPAGVEEAREDARLAIERLAIVQARLDALDGGRTPTAESGDHAATSEEHAASPDDHGSDATDEHATDAAGSKEAEDELPQWSYSGTDGPGKWASLAHEYATCASGQEQSPIDLAKGQVEGALELRFHYASAAGSVVDNGHSIQVDMPTGGYITIGERRFDLVYFVFRGPSEHTVGGRTYPLELQLVHKDSSGKYAVVGVLVEKGSANAPLGAVIDALPTTQRRPEALAKSIDATKLLPVMKSSFQYSGSLTTPPCTEGVAWSVLVAPITMSAEQVDTLRARFRSGNNRPIQPLGDRTLFVDFGAA